MAINNSKRQSKKDEIELANQEPQKEQKPERGPGFGDTKRDGNGIDIIPTADYKINRDGKKYKAHRIVFSNGHDDSKKGVSEMKKTLAQFVEELKGGQVKLDKNKNGKLDAHDFKLLRKRNLKETNMNKDLHPEAGKVLKHIKPEHHAKYTPDLSKSTYKGDYADRSAVLKAAERAGHLKEASTFDYKNTPRQTSDDTKTKTYHDVKKISTGTVYTKQFDKDGMSKGTGGDAAAKAENAPKRGRGRPKKDKFAESVEILMSLSEEQFDSMMEEGFDVFFEAYEQLDELSKMTLGSYVKSAAKDAEEAGRDQEYHGHKNDYKRGENAKQASAKQLTV